MPALNPNPILMTTFTMTHFFHHYLGLRFTIIIILAKFIESWPKKKKFTPNTPVQAFC